MNTKAMTTVSANKLRARARALTESETIARLEMAQVVHELYYGEVTIGGSEVPLYRFFGFESWFDYVEKEIGLHVSTAVNYRIVWDVFGVKLDGAWDKALLANVSFTKLRAIANVVDVRNVNAWLRRAAKLTCCAVDDEVQAALHGRRPRGARRRFGAFVTDRQLASIHTALDVAATQFPDAKTRGELLVRVVGQWHAAVGKTRHLKAVG
jgi:hypothetical protein